MDLLKLMKEEKPQPVYEGVGFKRQKSVIEAEDGEILVLSDRVFVDSTELSSHFVRINAGLIGGKNAFFKGEILECPREYGIILNSGGSYWWIPKNPFLRSYDEQGRMKSEIEAVISEKDGVISLNPVEGENGGEIEIVLIEFEDESLIKEIVDRENSEKQRYCKSNWFMVNSINDYWKYMVFGSVFDPRFKTRKFHRISKRFRCQECARAWQHYLEYLGEKTGKRIYELIIYQLSNSVMLELDSDGRWRHGDFTDDMETHTRYMADGGNLLIDHYLKSGDQAFIEKARMVGDKLIEWIDWLETGPWFIHDSLELPEEGHPYYKDHLRFKAFGKSPSNTFVLNTHIQTLSMMINLQNAGEDEKYGEIIHEALESTRKVLASKNGETPYKIVLGLYSYKKNLFGKVRNRICRRLLRYMKMFWPRLAYPNGFIDRDLTVSPMNEFYFLVNLKDLMNLYFQTGHEWIMEVVDRGFDVAVKKKFYKNLADGLVALHKVPDILLMHGAIKQKWEYESIADSSLLLYQKFSAISLDAVRFDWMKGYYPDSKPGLREDEGMIEIALGPKDAPGLLVINPLYTPKEAVVDLKGESKSKDINPQGWSLFSNNA